LFIAGVSFRVLAAGMCRPAGFVFHYPVRFTCDLFLNHNFRSYLDSFWLGIYRWPNVKADSPPNQIPEQWKQGKEWALISEIVEGSTASGIPYVTFKARMVRDGREPFDSIMTVLRSSSGAAFMFQMTGDAETIDAIRKSIRNQ